MSEERQTLYDITGRLKELYEICGDPDTDPQVWQDTFEAVTGERDDKFDGYAAVISKLKADGAAIKKMETMLCTKRKAIEYSIDRMYAKISESMAATNERTVKTQYWTFAIKRNQSHVVIDTDIRNIPEQYLKYAEPTIDKQALKDDLKNGEKLEGVAHLEQTERLDIR